MGIPSHISKFSSVASILFMGLGSAAVVIACGDDDVDLNLSTGGGSDAGTDSGKKTPTTTADAGEDAGPIDPVGGDVKTYTVGGAVTGLTAGSLVLTNNGGDDITVTADGAFVFATPVADTTGYAVAVKTQPAGQICAATLNSGTLAGANVTTVAVTCQKGFKVGGVITGLVGTGLVLENNGGDTLTVGADATTFTFAGLVPTTGPFDISVSASPAEQTCTVKSGGSGSIANADYGAARIECITKTYSLGGSIAGLVGGVEITLQNNGAGDIVKGNGDFSFGDTFVKGDDYAVTIAQPTATVLQQNALVSFEMQHCVLGANASGKVASANVTLAVTCATICGYADEGGNVALACPDGETIKSIDFASYGTPTGVCGAFAQAKAHPEDDAVCHAVESANVAAACVGQATCSVRFSNDLPLGDPCSGTRKYTYVQATCGK